MDNDLSITCTRVTPYDHSTDLDTNLDLEVRVYSRGAMTGGWMLNGGGSGDRALQAFLPNASHGGSHHYQCGDNIALRPQLEKTLKSTTCLPSRIERASEIWATTPEQRPSEATVGCDGKET
jgi:hypothetical protein